MHLINLSMAMQLSVVVSFQIFHVMHTVFHVCWMFSFDVFDTQQVTCHLKTATHKWWITALLCVFFLFPYSWYYKTLKSKVIKQIFLPWVYMYPSMSFSHFLPWVYIYPFMFFQDWQTVIVTNCKCGNLRSREFSYVSKFSFYTKKKSPNPQTHTEFTPWQ